LNQRLLGNLAFWLLSFIVKNFSNANLHPRMAEKFMNWKWYGSVGVLFEQAIIKLFVTTKTQ